MERRKDCSGPSHPATLRMGVPFGAWYPISQGIVTLLQIPGQSWEMSCLPVFGTEQIAAAGSLGRGEEDQPGQG